MMQISLAHIEFDVTDFVNRGITLSPRNLQNRNQLARIAEMIFTDKRPSGIVEVICGSTDITLIGNKQTLLSELKIFEYQTLHVGEQKHQIQFPICFDFALDFANDEMFMGIKKLLLTTKFTMESHGFIAGFLYCSGLSPEIILPRKNSPHKYVEPGSIGLITGKLGIYSNGSPAGWNIVGRIPIHIRIEEMMCYELINATICFNEIKRDEFEFVNTKKIGLTSCLI